MIQKFPKFEEMYREVSVFRYHPEEAVEMFSDALKKLDENTVNYMIGMLKDELINMGSALKEKDREIEVKDNIIKRMEREIAELRNV